MPPFLMTPTGEILQMLKLRAESFIKILESSLVTLSALKKI